MGIFSAIKHAIFGDSASATPAPAASAGSASPPFVAAPAAAPAAPAPRPAAPVDVEAILSAKPGAANLDWRHSIVDLLKLLELDSSLSARKELAGELDVHAGADGSAEQNIALHKAVMRALAEHGGTVPASLKD